MQSSSSSNSPSEKCQICYQSGHGYHFGAFTCRACAAFFRRCHFSPISNRKCRMFDQKCKPNSKSGRWYCKKCRMNKCLELGMKTDNIQYDRDAFKSSETFVGSREMKKRFLNNMEVPMTVESVLGEHHLVVFLKRETVKRGLIPVVDLTSLVNLATNTVLIPNLVRKQKKFLSNLEQLSFGLEEVQSTQRETLVEHPILTQSLQKGDWHRSMITAAQWLTSSELIRSLDDELKIDLLRGIWSIWGRLERVIMTANMRLKRLCGNRQFVISNRSLIDYDRLKSDISWWSRYSFEELAFFFNSSEVFYDDIVTDICNIKPDSVELTFLLSIISFQLAGKKIGGKVEKETERLQDVLADDLHNYYTRNHQTIYAYRMKQLMRIKENFLRLLFLREEKYKIGAKLNIFELEISHPQFFVAQV